MRRIIDLALMVAVLLSLAGCFYVVGNLSEDYEPALREQSSASIEGEVGQTSDSVSTDQEIVFRGLFWGIESETAKALMENDTESPFIFVLEEMAIPRLDSIFDLDPSGYVQGKAGTVIALGGLTAGGYDTLECKMYFNYKVSNSAIDRESDSFYLATYAIDCANTEEVYQGLFDKLSDLYGVGDQESWENQGFVVSEDYSGSYAATVTECTWTGANNTFVSLRGTHSENEHAWVGVWIAYGKSDVEEELQELNLAIQKENEEIEKEIGNAENNTGL